MKTILTHGGFLTLVLTMTATSHAQALLPYPGYGSGWLHHSSTLEEGIQRGAADITRAVGERNYLNSLAAINFQDAYSRFLKNQAQRVDTFFYMRQTNREQRANYAPKRFSLEQYTALAKNSAPDRLTEQEYDRTNGRINWPSALYSDDFALERDALERAFRSRSGDAFGPASEFYEVVRARTDAMDRTLQSYLGSLEPIQYMAAKNFLRSLGYEARYSPVPVKPGA